MRVIQAAGLAMLSLKREESDRRSELKAAGFKFHWELDSDRCPQPCAVCDAGLEQKFVWFTANADAARPFLVSGLTPLVKAPAADIQSLADRAPSTEASDPSRAMTASIDVPCPAGLRYRGFQLAAIDFARKRRNVLLGDEMGVGKTIETIGILNDTDAKRVLVVCPATLRGNWKNELERWLVISRPVYLPNTAAELPTAGATPQRCVVVVNAEKLIMSQKGSSLVERAGGLYRRLFETQWDVMVIDEAHRFGNQKAAATVRVLGSGPQGKKQTHALSQTGLVHQADRVLALTGTPMKNRPKEMWPLLNTLAPSEFKTAFQFFIRYCDAHKETITVKGGEEKEIWNLDGASNLGELQARLRRSVMIRRLKKDVLKELPSKVRQVLPIPGEYPNGAKPDPVERAFLAVNPEIAEAAADVQLAEALGEPQTLSEARDRLIRFTESLPAGEAARLRRELALAKIHTVIRHVDGLMEDGCGKVVIMGHHKDALEKLVAHFGQRCVGIWGDTPMGQRQGLIDRFQNDPEVTVFVGGILAAGVGLTLTAAHHMVFSEIDWVPANIWQAEDRIHRVGQTEPVTIQYLVLDGTIEANILGAALAKNDVAEQALDKLGLSGEPAKRYAPAPEALRIAINKGLKSFSSLKDKGAISQVDAKILTSLRKTASDRDLTDGQVWLALRLLRKHTKYLSPDAVRAIAEAT